MADRKVNIVLKAKDEASKVFENVANNTLPQFAKRIAQGLTAFASVAAIEETVRRSVGAALEAEKATAGLAAALKAQGATAVDALPGLKAHAEALSRVALADDEAVQGAQKVLVSIGGLLGSKLDDATKAALDLAAGLGIDLEQAATMVAKAAQGSTKEFGRLGFEFQKNATDAQKLDTVLAGVQARFGGMAEAETKTAAGQLHEFSEAWGELLETLGTKIVPAVANVGFLTKAMQALNDESNKPGGSGFFDTLVTILAGKVGIGGGLADIEKHLQLLGEHSKKLADNMAEDRLENPMIGYKDAVAQARAELKASADWAAELAKHEEAAKKQAEQLAEAIAKVNEKTQTQTFAPQQKTPKTPITGASSDFVIQSGIDNAAKDAEASAAINEQTDAVIQLSKSVKTVEEAWAAAGQIQQAIADATPEQQKVLLEMWDAFLGRAKAAETEIAAMQEGFNIAAQAATQFSDLMIDAAFGAKVEWDKALKAILVGLIKAIAQAYILKALETAFFTASGGGVAGASAGGIVGGSSVYASSGTVAGVPSMIQYLAAGGPSRSQFKPKGTDTVPAMLTPGEVVLPRDVSKALLSGKITVAAGPGRAARERGSKPILGGRLAALPAGRTSRANVFPSVTVIVSAPKGPSAPAMFADGGIVGAASGLIVQRAAMLMPASPSLPSLALRGRLTGTMTSPERPSSVRSSSPTRIVNLNVTAVDKRGIRELLIENADALSDALDYLDVRGIR